MHSCIKILSKKTSLIFVVLAHTSIVFCNKNFNQQQILNNCEDPFYSANQSHQSLLLDPSRFSHSETRMKPFLSLFKKVKVTEHVYSIAEDLSHYRVMVEYVVSRKDVETTFLNFETRLLIPQELAEQARIGGLTGVPPLDLSSFVATEGVRYSPHTSIALTSFLKNQGYLEAVQSFLQDLETKGHREIESLASQGLEFYMKHVERRRLTEETKEDLRNDFWKTLPFSTLSISRKIGTSKIVGTLQTIRAPYGTRVVTKNEKAVEASYGDWGPSYRKLAYLHPLELAATDEQLFDLDSLRSLDIDSQDKRFHFKPPVERRMNENGLELRREVYVDLPGKHMISQDGEDEDIVVYFGSGEVVEHSRFAIDAEENTALFANIYVQLFANAIDTDFSDVYNLLYRTYWTYNDFPKLYDWAGYEETGDSVEIHGRKFKILKVVGKDHIRALLEFSHRFDADDQEIIDHLKNLYSRFGVERFSIDKESE